NYAMSEERNIPVQQARRERAQQVLAEASSVLSGSLDWEDTLAAVAELAVRSLADFCVIDIVEDGEIKRVKAAHADPAKVALTERLLDYPPESSAPHPTLEAIGSGKPIIIRDAGAEML